MEPSRDWSRSRMRHSGSFCLRSPETCSAAPYCSPSSATPRFAKRFSRKLISITAKVEVLPVEAPHALHCAADFVCGRGEGLEVYADDFVVAHFPRQAHQE